jgi:hypothetical protein
MRSTGLATSSAKSNRDAGSAATKALPAELRAIASGHVSRAPLIHEDPAGSLTKAHPGQHREGPSEKYGIARAGACCRTEQQDLVGPLSTVRIVGMLAGWSTARLECPRTRAPPPGGTLDTRIGSSRTSLGATNPRSPRTRASADSSASAMSVSTSPSTDNDRNVLSRPGPETPDSESGDRTDQAASLERSPVTSGRRIIPASGLPMPIQQRPVRARAGSTTTHLASFTGSPCTARNSGSSVRAVGEPVAYATGSDEGVPLVEQSARTVPPTALRSTGISRSMETTRTFCSSRWTPRARTTQITGTAPRRHQCRRRRDVHAACSRTRARW